MDELVKTQYRHFGVRSRPRLDSVATGHASDWSESW